MCYRKSALGAIDPDFFTDPATGRHYLVWKNEGIQGVHPPRLMVRRLTASGTAFRPGSSARILVERDQSWEGSVVENPSMIAYAGRYYLLYSGNAWASADYATGYAICEGPRGPCAKPRNRPLLRSEAGVAGPRRPAAPPLP